MRRRDRIYTACEQFNFEWENAQVLQVMHAYQHEIPLADIAEKLKRKPEEVAFLLVDLADQGQIEPRKTGVWGCGGNQDRPQ